MTSFRVVAVLAAWVSLSAASAQTLIVETVPPGAEVAVDGRAAGPSPAVVSAPPGTWQVRATLARYDAAEASVAVAAGDTARVLLRLTPAAGSVRVVGLPADAETETPGWAITGEVSRVGPGVSTLRVRLPGQPDLFARIPVQPGAETLVEFVDEFSTRGFASNFVLPGSSQLARGRPVSGLGYALGTAAALAAVGAAHLRVADADADLHAAVEAYRAARSEADVAAAYTAIDAAYGRGRDGRRLRTGALAAAGTVYLASLLDAALHYGRQPTLRVRTPGAAPAWSLRATPRGLAAHLSF